MKFIYNETRRLTADKYICSNGNTREYRSELNGKMLKFITLLDQYYEYL